MTELIEEYIEAEIKTEAASNAYLQTRIGNALDNKKKMWKELCHPCPKWIKCKFCWCVCFASGEYRKPGKYLQGGWFWFAFSLGDVELAVKHFSQACGKEGIPQSVIFKPLTFIGTHLVKLFKAFFAQGIIWKLWEGPGFWLFRKYLFHLRHPIPGL